MWLFFVAVHSMVKTGQLVNSYQLRLEKLPTHDEIHHQEQPSFLQADQETTMAWEKNMRNLRTKKRKESLSRKHICGVYLIY